MPQDDFELPLFPLSAHLLPGGIMALRIFEPRYVNMVKAACAEQSGFGICMLNASGDKAKNTHIFSVGTYAEVVDFDLLEDGLLGIQVSGQRSFEILNIHTQSDGLRVGLCRWLSEWPSTVVDKHFEPISNQLQAVFSEYDELRNQYPQPRFDEPIWVLSRWLELLPIEPKIKQQFIAQRDCSKVIHFLSNLVL